MLNLVANGPSGYNLTNSLRFRASASAYLSRTPASAGNRTTWTYSVWVKRGTLSSTMYLFGASSTTGDVIRFLSTDDIEFYFGNGAGGDIRTTQVFRDPSAWYHLVFVCDTTQATASNRMKIYVNGIQITSFSSATYPSLNYNTTFNTAVIHNIAGFSPYFDGYMTEINFIDGQALTPSSFGSTNATTGVWQPAKYTGTYGTNGFYLNFNSIALTSGSNTGLGKDNSGNGNYWNTNNISVTAGTTYDAMTDVPTLTSTTVANYCVLNPLDNGGNTLSAGNLNAAGGVDKLTRATFGMSSGKWYCEVTITAVGGSTNIGIANSSASNTSLGNNANSWAYANNGQKVTNASGSAYGSSFTTGDIIGIAFDADAGSLTFYKNNTSQGTAFTGLTSGPYFIAFGSNAPTLAFNFGQRPFTYTPPTSFVALNTYNLTDSTIVKGNKYMDATLYTGNLTGQSITNAAAFKPDLVWIKSRSAATDHKLTDSVRGATVALVSNTTAAETTDTTGMTAFNTNGFTVGASTTYNNTGATYVGWQWQAGQGSSSSNTNGSITSTVSVNATAGFSIVTFTKTGTATVKTVGHGLGVAPSMIIVKVRNGVDNWPVYHISNGATFYQELNTTIGKSSGDPWGNTTPTSSVFSIKDNGTGTQVAYCWAEIAGFSKAFSYTGNGSTDGPFVFCNFRPKYILVKRTDAVASWIVWDSARDTYNVVGNELNPNTSGAEATGSVDLDFLSNGFKLRSTYNGTNTSSGTYIGIAFAENPFKNALAR